ncbi:MAG TPA: glutamate--tRNA ligase, partial [Spirochaetota bacterium]|nr:glutamate--tRNA ligase [Spirochaetota bacterium]
MVDLYKKYALELVEKGWAYFCYCDSERLERIKKIQEANKLPPGYDRHCRNLSNEERAELEKSGITPVIRFKAPLEGKTSFDDKILGKIEVDNSTLQDFVLLKSDGFPTYHMANIVDDHLMEITHVLRAQEWVPSTPNHILLYKAFGWEPPTFCHLPMVMGEDGHKLSKRHGSTHLIEFKNNGYLPEAIVNFVSLLGWSYNDKDEVFSLADLAKVFEVERINKAPAVFNYGKLKWFNSLYIRKLTDEALLELVLPHYIKTKLIGENPSQEEISFVKKIIPLIKERLELINDAPEISDFMFGDIPPYKTWEAIIPKNVTVETVIGILTEAK